MTILRLTHHLIASSIVTCWEVARESLISTNPLVALIPPCVICAFVLVVFMSRLVKSRHSMDTDRSIDANPLDPLPVVTGTNLLPKIHVTAILHPRNSAATLPQAIQPPIRTFALVLRLRAAFVLTTLSCTAHNVGPLPPRGRPVLAASPSCPSCPPISLCPSLRRSTPPLHPGPVRPCRSYLQLVVSGKAGMKAARPGPRRSSSNDSSIHCRAVP